MRILSKHIGYLWICGTIMLFMPKAQAFEPNAISIEGGVSLYTGSLGSLVRPGGAWGLRFEHSPLNWLSLQAAYVGSANRLEGNWSDTPPVLQRDGGLLGVKLSSGDQRVEPFVELGAQISRFHVRQKESGCSLSSQTVGGFPVAAGMQFYFGALRAGIRLGYDFIIGGGSVGGGGSMASASLTLGARF